MNQNKLPLDPHPLSDYVVWAGGRSRESLVDIPKKKPTKNLCNVLEFADGMSINCFSPHFERLHFQQADKKPIFNI